MTFLLILALIGGMSLSVQAAINGRLGAQVGVLASAWLTFTVGAVISLLLILFFEPAHSQTLLTVPKWQLTGALFGVVYMVVMVAAVPRLGVTIATVATILGQMIMSLLIDSQGWLHNAAIELNPWRLAAMVATALALVCIYLANKESDQ
ncbi:DMT family transporter [Ferrimonas senticii]|uniref:DMT family transporter n=1 Tax=Ferrimonas senticii TaxID=394566 RepID=UPI000410F803|nr:DMT family transporter [Ferrimonas senticii]